MIRTATGRTITVLVPVLPAPGPVGHLPGTTVRLHGQALFVHAARTAHEVSPGSAVVSVPRGAAAAVRAQLAADGLGGVRVIEGGETLGAVLAALVAELDVVAVDRQVVDGLADDVAMDGLVLVHDPRCPLLPPEHLHAVATSAAASTVVVSTRPMTDTVKSVVDGVVLATVDRDLLRVLSSPLVLPIVLLRQWAAAAASELAACVDVEDLLELVRAQGTAVHWSPAPATGRRVSDAAAAAVLECLTEVRAART